MHPTRIFKSVDDLQKAWDAYKDNLKVEALKWEKVQYVGKDGERVKDNPKLPLTMEGFSVFCYSRYGTIRHYFLNTDKYYDDFCTICSHIVEEIRQDQITGGLLGFYNPSITQRLNNLKESTEQTISANVNILNIDPLSDSADHSTKKDIEPS